MLIDLDDELAAVLRDAGRSSGAAIRELIVLGLYGEGQISSGRAAELLAISRLDFIRRAAEAGIPYFRMSGDELRGDIERAKGNPD